jgi:hypothetical protein
MVDITNNNDFSVKVYNGLTQLPPELPGGDTGTYGPFTTGKITIEYGSCTYCYSATEPYSSVPCGEETTTTTTLTEGAFLISSTGAGDSGSACSLPLDTQLYHTGVGTQPAPGDTVTVDYPPTSGFDGNSLWYRISTGVIQIFSDGTVMNFATCP